MGVSQELNRQKKFSQVVELYEKHRLLFLNDPMSWEYKEKLSEQYYLAKHELEMRRAAEPGAVAATPRKPKHTFKRTLLYIMSGTLLFYALTGVVPLVKLV